MKPKTQLLIALTLLLAFLVFLLYILNQISLIWKEVQASDFKIDIQRDEVVKNEVLTKTYHGYQYDDIGTASWYDYDLPKGSGNWITKHEYVTASRKYPKGTLLEICNKGILDTNSFPTDCVEVKVTDYGPEEKTGRIIDMGSLAFGKICGLKYGICKVLIKKL